MTHTLAATIAADSRYSYVFDACDRLVRATSINAGPNHKIEFTYYPGQAGVSSSSPIGPRATKKVYEWRSGAWVSTWTHGFVYDGWNLVHEKITCRTGVTEQVTTRDYFWGLDLSGQKDGRIGQDAGGIGGLISITEKTGGSTSIYLPICDHNGNISAVIDAATRQVVARYIYSPFGVLIGEYGAKVDVCPFRFQSKFFDKETGLYYFGYRYYDPASTKWLSNDPLGEQAGPNLSAFCGDNPVNARDPFGLWTQDAETGEWYPDSTDFDQSGNPLPTVLDRTFPDVINAYGKAYGACAAPAVILGGGVVATEVGVPALAGGARYVLRNKTVMAYVVAAWLKLTSPSVQNGTGGAVPLQYMGSIMNQVWSQATRIVQVISQTVQGRPPPPGCE